MLIKFEYKNIHKYSPIKDDGISTALWPKKFRKGFPGNCDINKIKIKYPIEQHTLKKNQK